MAPAKERLVLTIINYWRESDDFLSISFRKKCSKMLCYFVMVWFLNKRFLMIIWLKSVPFEWFEEDMNVILDDYAWITQKIKEGRAHELNWIRWQIHLSTCTKGAEGQRLENNLLYGMFPAKQRALGLKSSYMTYLINHKFVSHEQESVLATKERRKTFYQLIEEKIFEV